MKIEEQVTLLETSKKLKELGVKQKSVFYWIVDPQPRIISNTVDGDQWSADFPEKYFSAFTATELGEILPFSIDRNKFLYIWKDDIGRWRVAYCSSNDLSIWSAKPVYQIPKFKSEAEARANMLIFLIENKFIKIK